MKKLVYLSLFFNRDYISLLRLLVESLALSDTDTSKFDILVFTQKDMAEEIKKVFEDFGVNGKVKCMDFLYSKKANGRRRTQQRHLHILDSSQMSLRIWEWEDIDLYDKLLYLDVDVLIIRDLNEILDMQLENKLYAEKESTINNKNHGGELFDFSKIEEHTPAFCGGVLLFNNCTEVKELFERTLRHVDEHVDSCQRIPKCLEQPFLIYHTIMGKLNHHGLTDKIQGDNRILHHFNKKPDADGHYIAAHPTHKDVNWARRVKYNIMKKYLDNLKLGEDESAEIL